jgi:hypothetical protein
MNLRRVVGLSFVAAAISISLPAILSAQNSDRPQVRITLLKSGEIEINGDVVLESPATNQEFWLSGTSVIEDQNRDPDAPSGAFLLGLRSPTLQRVSDSVMRGRDVQIVRIR